MSSGPVGLDVREYCFAYEDFTAGATEPGMYKISSGNRWLITRIRYWTDAAPGVLQLQGMFPSQVAAYGCLCLEPNGAFRGDVSIQGAASRVAIEYWYQVTSTGDAPEITAVV